MLPGCILMSFSYAVSLSQKGGHRTDGYSSDSRIKRADAVISAPRSHRLWIFHSFFHAFCSMDFCSSSWSRRPHPPVVKQWWDVAPLAFSPRQRGCGTCCADQPQKQLRNIAPTFLSEICWSFYLYFSGRVKTEIPYFFLLTITLTVILG